MFLNSFTIFQGLPPEMTLRFVHDVEVICPNPKLLHAKLYGPRVNRPRVTGYAYGLFI